MARRPLSPPAAMNANLTVKVRTRRIWLFRLAVRVATIGHRLGLRTPALSRLLTWGVQRVQLRFGKGQWVNLSGSVSWRGPVA